MAADVTTRRRAVKIARELAREYPDAACALDFTSPLELLVATILSAQCTDKRVNMVTPALFRKYRRAADYAAAPQAKLEKEIQSTGFFRNKAKNIRECCKLLVARHGGEVPQDMDSLVALPGVGRKTANVVLGTAFRIAAGIVVDTHVTRVTHRLGLSTGKDAEKIEQELMALAARKDWIDFAHRIVHHGRRICVARKPKCDDCTLRPLCPRIGVATP
jgi:endonuclease III